MLQEDTVTLPTHLLAPMNEEVELLDQQFEKGLDAGVHAAFDSRWACPKCGSKDVEIALPMWCKEDMGYDLTPCHLDGEADVLYWLCNTCESSDSGEPIDLLKE